MTVFISHHHADRSYAQRLFEELKARGFTPWLYEAIEYGADLEKSIQDKLSESAAVILLLTPQSVASPTLQAEIERAFSLKKKIFPILLRSVSENPLQRLKYVDARDGQLPSDDFYKQLGYSRMQSRLAGDVTTDAPPPEKKEKGNENDYSLSQ